MQVYDKAEAAFHAALLLAPEDESAKGNLLDLARFLPPNHPSMANGAIKSARMEDLELHQQRAMALSEEERSGIEGVNCAMVSIREAHTPRVRLVPPRNDSTWNAFVAACGIKHKVSRLPRVNVRDFFSLANAHFAHGEAPFILTGTVPRGKEALAKILASGTPGSLASVFGNETTDFYPNSMVHHDVHPFLVPFSTAMEELLEPSEAFELNKIGSRGGRYLHLNMGAALWRSYFGGMLASAHFPPNLLSTDVWLREAFDTDAERDDFTIGTHWRMLLVGTEGAGMFHHQDILKTASTQFQVTGYKTWHICAPSETPFLSVEHDMFSPDYERWPAALNARCYLDVLAPGEILFYGADYWHQTLNTPANSGELAVSITDTLVDPNNFERVKVGLLEKCKNPTPFNRGGLTAEACKRLPRLFAWWDERHGATAAQEL